MQMFNQMQKINEQKLRQIFLFVFCSKQNSFSIKKRQLKSLKVNPSNKLDESIDLNSFFIKGDFNCPKKFFHSLVDQSSVDNQNNKTEENVKELLNQSLTKSPFENYISNQIDKNNFFRLKSTRKQVTNQSLVQLLQTPSLNYKIFNEVLNHQKSLNQSMPESKLNKEKQLFIQGKFKEIGNIKNKGQPFIRKSVILKPFELKRYSDYILYYIRENKQNIQKNNQQQRIIPNYNSFYDQIGGLLAIETIIDKLYIYLLKDQNFRCNRSIIKNYLEYFDTPHLQFTKQAFVRLIIYLTGENTFYMLETLRERHKDYNLDTYFFNLFKLYLLKSFITVIPNINLVFQFSVFIEKTRKYILNKDPLVDQPEFVHQVSRRLYESIQMDQMLEQYFYSVDINNQIGKMAVIIKKLLINDSCKRELDIHALRKVHAPLMIKPVHLTYFRIHIIKQLREMKLKDNKIYLISKKIDGFKNCILNEDSWYDKIDQKNLKQQFISRYQKRLLNDRVLNKLIEAKGKEYIIGHTQIIYQYFSSLHLQQFTNNDLIHFHNQKTYWLTIEEFECFQDHFIHLCQFFKIEDNQLKDLIEDWDYLKLIVFNNVAVGKKIGKKLMDELKANICNSLEKQISMIDYFYNNRFTLVDMVENVIKFIFYDIKYFKKSDLKIIHQRVGVTKTSFHFLAKVMEQEMKQLSINELYITHAISKLVSYETQITDVEK